MFWSSLFHKPEPPPIRYVVATRSESRAYQRRKADVLCELAVFVAVTTPEQRAAEREAYWAKMRGKA